MKVFTAQQMRDFDRAATEEYGIPSIVLMENAALRVVEFLEMKFSPLREKRIVIFCGKGNNGGDGFAIARHLSNYDGSLVIVVACAPQELKGDALVNYEILSKQSGVRIEQLALDPDKAEEDFNEYEADILLDALLGTGFKGEIRGDLLRKAFLSLHNSATLDNSTIAIDIPSGLDSDTGAAAELCPTANYTVTFAAPKRGMFLRDGMVKCGEIWVGGIGTLTLETEFTDTGCECITHQTASDFVPDRPVDSHKGDAGRVLLIGGSYGMSGAPTLAARAVLRSGAGLCIAAVPDKILPIFAAAFPEATSRPLACDEDGALLENSADGLDKLWENAHAVALGPGIGRSEETLNFVRRIVKECPKPLVIDADALYALRAIEADLKTRKTETILTPHPGEMSELMQMKTSEVQENRIETALACAEKYNATVVLKGSRSIVATHGGSYINLTGNSGMATGGSGDILTGTIAGLLAQNKNPLEATLLGVYLHGLAGDIAYAEKGNGLIAGDIAENLPRALVKLQKPEEPLANARLRPLR